MQATISRRSALTLLALSSGAALLAACGQGAPAAPASPTSAPAAAPAAPAPATSAPAAATSVPASAGAAATSGTVASAPKPGGTVRVGLASEPANVDGHIRTPGSDLTYWLAFDRLVDYDDKAQPQPGLAETWDVAPDFKSVTFHLRKGVSYHSGREFTSDDVKWNFLRVRDPKLGGSTLGAYRRWGSTIETPDKYPVTLKSDLPPPTLFGSLQLFNKLDQPSMEGPDAKSTAVG